MVKLKYISHTKEHFFLHIPLISEVDSITDILETFNDNHLFELYFQTVKCEYYNTTFTTHSFPLPLVGRKSPLDCSLSDLHCEEK